MKICKLIRKIPAGMMLIPLLLGCIINTFFPKALEIGGFTTALFKDGTSTILAAYILCSGSTIKFNNAGLPLYKGAVLTLIKFSLGCLAGYGLNYVFGPAGVLGIAPVTVIAAMTNSNGAIYTALANEFGDSTDPGAIAVLSLNVGPFLTMAALGAGGIAAIPVSSLIATIIPLLIGMILGNLDEEFRRLFSSGMEVLLPFSGFVLGANMSFKTIVSAGLPGIVLGLGTVFFTGVLAFLLYSFIRRKWDPMGMAIGDVGANAVATPAAVALMDRTFQPYVDAATAQIAAAVVVGAIAVPILTGMCYKFSNKKNFDRSGLK